MLIRSIRYSLALLILLALDSRGFSQESSLHRWIDALENQLPTSVADCTQDRREPLAKAADAIDKWAAHLSRYPGADQPNQILNRVDELLVAQQRVDLGLKSVLGLRSKFAAEPLGETRRNAIRNYLRTVSTMIDVASRLRWQLSGALDFAAYRLEKQPELRDRLIDLLRQRKSSIGASVMAVDLFDPPQDSQRQIKPASEATKANILKLIAETGEISQIDTLARFVRQSSAPPALVIQAADVMRRLGIPQNPPPKQDAKLPKPAITAGQLHEILSQLNASKISSKLARTRQGLLDQLAATKVHGLQGDSFSMGNYQVKPGDFMLMRNPSPYNLFTDLSPGLFTHVGIVTMERGSDGRRRMVIVDLPERERSIPATNVEVYAKRSLHYVFLRHPDPTVARKLAATALAVIGNESEFDLNFRIDRLTALKGKVIKGQKIKTYCAGLLFLCAQETGRPRESFFPIPEGVAKGNTAANIDKMGFSVGKDFISPTGALFSPELIIVGHRQPIYDPTREIEEAVFDHFAQGLVDKRYVPSRTLYQDLRLKLANYAKDNPQLAAAIRQKENLGDTVDLVAAAKALAVVETLDEVAFGNSREYVDAHRAITTDRLESLTERGFSLQKIAELKKLRQKHADLHQRAAKLTPRQLRIELVNYYLKRGKADIDRRFFGAEK